MKIIQSIEAIYEEQKPLNEVLKNRVDSIFQRIKSDSWHYFSRVKQLESFALKLETGRFKDPKQLEDFFACTIVVENLDQIKKVTSLISDNFHIISQRPKKSNVTHKEPSSFQFDDLRLYAKIIQAEYLPQEPVNNVVFEIQVKTFLQHAWSLATHDLIYKSDEINWAKERIAFQIKAILEQAELTISGVNNLINMPEVLKENYDTIRQKKIVEFYKFFFSLEDLPKDIVRLCKNTDDLLKAFNLKIEDLKKILEKENNEGRGINQKNLSPFLLIIQSVINQQPNIIEKFLEVENRYKIIFPKELQFTIVSLKNEINLIKF